MSFEPRAGTAGTLRFPLELAFLLWQGVRPDILIHAMGEAHRAGTDGATALLRAGLMSEDAYYRALARALGSPYLEDLALAPGARYPDSVLAGAAPLRPGPWGTLVLAPQGAAIAELLRHGGGRPPAITAPARLRAAVLHLHGAEAARRAAETLEVRAPDWAYRPGLLPAQGLTLGLSLAAVPLLLDAPAALQGAALAAGNLLFLGMMLFRLAAVIEPPLPVPDYPRAADADLPVYTVLVALHREAAVVPHLIGALERLDYPAAKLDVKLVLEADDAETAGALAARALPPWIEIVVAPPGLPRTKPRALNVALALARGEYLVVYDAEDVPDPGQLRMAAAIFAGANPRTACLQGRLVIDNTGDSWLTRCFTLEYTALFDVLIPALAAWRLPVPLGGTTTHFRTATLRTLHGWDAWNVTEDADLGLRLALAGYHVGDLPLSTEEEAPAEIRPWLRQRVRWMKGFVQTTITHSRRPAAAATALGPLGSLCALALIPGTVVSALVYPALLAVAGWRIVLSPAEPDPSFWVNMVTALGLVLFGAGLAALLLPAARGCLQRRWWGLLPWICVLPVYYGLMSVAAWLSLAELVLAPSRWNKTEHGRARTSRSGALAARPCSSEPPRDLRGGVGRRPHQVEGADEVVGTVHDVDERGMLHRVVSVLQRHLAAIGAIGLHGTRHRVG
ncbi:glycosyl transferase family protein [Methylobacterium nodulans ORS 2060]|uniref:Glycosyl transferase family protein n=1 Tax=Methylobacterium nodulans (strain LMG 21967 / CNCM I-2342 / ORS 2060) TaxID=460265 RepID=B8IGT7_METNO|nr:glycosyl transferase family protein [Methylobacterium nodulans ORS 2060]